MRTGASAPADDEVNGPSLGKGVSSFVSPGPPAAGTPRSATVTKPSASGLETLRRRGAIRRRFLALADGCAALSGLMIAYVLVPGSPSSAVLWSLLFAPAWILVAKVHGLYDNDHRRVRHSTFDEIPPLLSTAAFGTLVIAGLLSLTPAPEVSANEAIAVAAIALGANFAFRGLVRGIWRNVTPGESAAIIGSGRLAATVARRLWLHPEAGLNLIGYFSDTGNGSGALADLGLRSFGSVAELPKVAAEHGVQRIVIADESLDGETISDVVARCHLDGIGLTLVPSNPQVLGRGVELNRIAELPVLDFRFSDPSRSTMADQAGAGPLRLGAWLLILLAPAAARHRDPDPARLAGPGLLPPAPRSARTASRSRCSSSAPWSADAEQRLHELVDLDDLDEPAFKIHQRPPGHPGRAPPAPHQPRRAARSSSTSCKGDMSLVGPRPEEEAVVALYDERQRARLAVKPGLTGPMQVYGRGDLTFEERLAIERDYLDNLSVDRGPGDPAAHAARDHPRRRRLLSPPGTQPRGGHRQPRRRRAAATLPALARAAPAGAGRCG